MARPKAALVVTEMDRQVLESMAHRARTAPQGVDGLLDEPRPGTPRKIDDTQVEDVVTRTLEGTPRGATHWSTRTLAKPNQQRLGPYLRQLRPGVLAG